MTAHPEVGKVKTRRRSQKSRFSNIAAQFSDRVIDHRIVCAHEVLYVRGGFGGFPRRAVARAIAQAGLPAPEGRACDSTAWACAAAWNDGD
jgi:hypothetical protein